MSNRSKSILPIVDEYVVLVGKSEDGTLDMIKAIGSDKVRIVENEWRDDFKWEGEIFSHLTNIAMSECKGDWAFSLQADEVIHEKDLPELKQLVEECDKKPLVKAISLRFIHFYGDYRTYNPYSHRKACRIIRNNGEVRSIGDGVAFALLGAPRRILEGPKEHYVKSNIRIYHYTSVKTPEARGEVKSTEGSLPWGQGPALRHVPLRPDHDETLQEVPSQGDGKTDRGVLLASSAVSQPLAKTRVLFLSAKTRV